jgi:hypothetical protein
MTAPSQEVTMTDKSLTGLEAAVELLTEDRIVLAGKPLDDVRIERLRSVVTDLVAVATMLCHDAAGAARKESVQSINVWVARTNKRISQIDGDTDRRFHDVGEVLDNAIKRITMIEQELAVSRRVTNAPTPVPSTSYEQEGWTEYKAPMTFSDSEDRDD